MKAERKERGSIVWKLLGAILLALLLAVVVGYSTDGPGISKQSELATQRRVGGRAAAGGNHAGSSIASRLTAGVAARGARLNSAAASR